MMQVIMLSTLVLPGLCLASGFLAETNDTSQLEAL